MLDHHPRSQQVSPCFVEKKLRLAEQVLGTNPRWLRKSELIDGDNDA